MTQIKVSDSLMELFNQYHVSFRYSISEDPWLTEGCWLDVTAGCCIETYSSFFRPSPIHTMGAFSYSWTSFGINVVVGRYCSIAAGVKILPDSHPLDYFTTSSVTYDRSLSSLDGLRYATVQSAKHPDIESLPYWPNSYPNKKSIVIENDMYIGVEAVLRPGIVIGNGSVVAAYSVVTRDVPPYSVVAGNPATIKKQRFHPEVADELLRLSWWNYSIEDILKMGVPKNINTFIDALKTRIKNGDVRKESIDYISYDQIMSHSK